MSSDAWQCACGSDSGHPGSVMRVMRWRFRANGWRQTHAYAHFLHAYAGFWAISDGLQFCQVFRNRMCLRTHTLRRRSDGTGRRYNSCTGKHPCPIKDLDPKNGDGTSFGIGGGSIRKKRGLYFSEKKKHNTISFYTTLSSLVPSVPSISIYQYTLSDSRFDASADGTNMVQTMPWPYRPVPSPTARRRGRGRGDGCLGMADGTRGGACRYP
jgi:hypothetical protein